MTIVQPLSPTELYASTDPSLFTFETTADLPPLEQIIGQDRAMESVEFGMGIRRPGFNVFALGSTGSGRHELIEDFLTQQAANEPIPSDWCYVYNFEDSYRPLALELPAGQGIIFGQDMKEMIDELRTVLPATFETEEYRIRRQAVEARLREHQESAYSELQEEARRRHLDLLRTPSGLVFAPVDENNEVIEPESFQKLHEAEKDRIRSDIAEMQTRLQAVLQQVPDWEREVRKNLSALQEEVAHFTVDPILGRLLEKYAEMADVVRYLTAVQADILQNIDRFIQIEGSETAAGAPETAAASRGDDLRRLSRYQVNLLVDRSHLSGAPVVYEDNPAYGNLVGRVEYMTRMGGMDTDFTLIRAGALHRANGGYLMIDARRLLLEPYAWEGLKRALRSDQIRIETPGQMLSQVNVITLEPQPIPLDVKIALVGDRSLYYMLSQNDPDFEELFKVAADFEDHADRTPAFQQLYAHLIATMAQERNLRPLDRESTARVVDEGARMAADAHKLSMRVNVIADLLQEADYWAARNGVEVIRLAHIEQALAAQEYRSGRIPERSREAILQGTIHIATDGAAVGQINGLSVLDLGKIRFGQPSRITARVRMGRGEVVGIEREVALSGQIHSKGVLILASFLSSRYATDYPLSLHASLVFEQSYGGVDGDSASSTELYALLSALAAVPIRQSLAVTGSVDQFGNVQAIGGVNEKIEGFFAICQARGLNGEQGVLIPQANVRNLMLRRPVIDAVSAGKFQIYPVSTIDQGIELLTGLTAGQPDEAGEYPEGTINRRVQDRLRDFARRWFAFHRPGGEQVAVGR
ncbi:MAG: AAA family ATPase [Caldilineaceae bacterium]|nr:AAA family ATPase [Caldilineaceae bacterium]